MTENVNQGVKVSRVTILTIPDYVLHINDYYFKTVLLLDVDTNYIDRNISSPFWTTWNDISVYSLQKKISKRLFVNNAQSYRMGQIHIS